MPEYIHTCPHCQGESRLQVPESQPQQGPTFVPSPPKTDSGASPLSNSALPQGNPDEIAAAVVGKLEGEWNLAGQLQEAEERAHRFEHGPSTLGMENLLEHWRDCPGCSNAFNEYLEGQRQEAVQGLGPEQVKEVARGQGWWPPPDIDFPDGLVTRRLRR